jgi:hypothetical protein
VLVLRLLRRHDRDPVHLEGLGGGHRGPVLARRASLDLDRSDMNPGTIDGVFGSNSQLDMRALQRWVDGTFGSGAVTVDGLAGPRVLSLSAHVALTEWTTPASCRTSHKEHSIPYLEQPTGH